MRLSHGCVCYFSLLRIDRIVIPAKERHTGMLESGAGIQNVTFVSRAAVLDTGFRLYDECMADTMAC